MGVKAPHGFSPEAVRFGRKVRNFFFRARAVTLISEKASPLVLMAPLPLLGETQIIALKVLPGYLLIVVETFCNREINW